MDKFLVKFLKASGVITALLIILSSGAQFAMAEGGRVSSLLDKAGQQTGYDTKAEPALYLVVGRFINLFLTSLGVMFVVLAIYAGYLWMTAEGKADQVEKAKNILRNSLIGLGVTVGAYAITYFIVYSISNNSGLINQDYGF